MLTLYASYCDIMPMICRPFQRHDCFGAILFSRLNTRSYHIFSINIIVPTYQIWIYKFDGIELDQLLMSK